jgi:hypothetical protein
MGRFLSAILLTVLVFLAVGAPAQAHGPCYCLSTTGIRPAQRITVARNYRVTKAVWNPNPFKLTNPALALLYNGKFYHRREKTLTLLRRTHPERGANLTVPSKVRPGKYLLALFDGTEGGTHYTWDVVKVKPLGEMPATGIPASSLAILALCLFTMGLTVHLATRASK